MPNYPYKHITDMSYAHYLREDWVEQAINMAYLLPNAGAPGEVTV